MMPRRPMHTLKPNRLASGIRRARGITLLELLLGLGAASVITTAVFLAFQPTDVRAEVQQTQFDLSDTATRIERSLGLTGNFAGLDNSLVTGDRLMPSRLYRNGRLENAWGGTVTFTDFTVSRPADAFLVRLRDVPKAACVPLVSSLAGNVWDARVGSESVFLDKRFDPATTASTCERLGGDEVSFVFYSGLVAGSAVATPSLTLPPAPPSGANPPAPTTPTGPVAGAPSVDDATPGTPGAVSPGTPVAPPPVAPVTPAPAPVTPGPGASIPPSNPTNPPALSRCTIPGPDYQNVATCPAGTWGMVQQTRTWSCPEAWASAEPGPWSDTGNTCTACPGPETESTTQWVGASQACPAGQTGAHTWEAEQVATRQRSYHCPAGTTVAPGPTYGGWSAWNATGNRRNESNTCATQGLVITSGFVNLSVANAYGTVGTRTLTEATAWTYLAGQSSEWSSSWGPVRGNGSIEITYNGMTATVAGGGNSSNTARPGSPTSFTASNQTVNFNGKRVEFEFRGNASTDNGSVIRGSVAFYYRVLP